jgi:hypothetical protein
MDVRKELFKALVKTHILIRRDDEGFVESPYVYPIDDLEHIVCELAGISDEEDDRISNEAVDFAWEICHILGIERKD